jgi:hypothetical protein
MRPAVFALVWLLAGGSLFAQTPVAADEGIDRLIAQLSSAKYAERAAAMQALEDKGEAALPALLKVANQGDLEQQRRVALLIERIENRLAVAPWLTAKKAPLVYKDVLVLDALPDFFARKGFWISTVGWTAIQNDRITVDAGEVTFWEAYTRLCESAGLIDRELNPVEPWPNPNPYHVWVKVGKQEKLPTTLAGPLRFRALPPGKDKSAAFLLEVWAEPLMPWQGLRLVRLTTIIDQQGKLLPVPEPLPVPALEVPAHRAGLPPGTVFAPQVVPIRLPTTFPAGTVLKEVQGSVTGTVEVLRKLAVIPNVTLAKGKTFPLNKDPNGLKVVEVQRNEDRLLVRLRIEGPLAVTISRDALRPEEKKRPLTTAKCVLLDAKGQPWKLVIEEVVSGQDANVLFAEVLAVFERQAKQEEPAQLLFHGAVSLPLEIPLVLREVPVV